MHGDGEELPQYLMGIRSCRWLARADWVRRNFSCNQAIQFLELCLHVFGCLTRGVDLLLGLAQSGLRSGDGLHSFLRLGNPALQSSGQRFAAVGQ